MLSAKRPMAIDLSHHLSELSRLRATSPLKGFKKYSDIPGMIVLSGGFPSPAYYPFAAISGDVLLPDSFSLAPSSHPHSSLSRWLRKFFSWSSTSEHTTTVTVPKYSVNPGDVNLASALQYSFARAIPALQDFLQHFTPMVYQPAYEDFTILVHTGNTDGLYKVALTLCNPGEAILVADWTYVTALVAVKPHNIKTISIATDGQGIRSDDLRRTLLEWDDSTRGTRPHVLYVVPVGQNPTGTTMGASRKKAIYDICVEFDIIIVEDDPYFFLQEGDYIPKSQRGTPNAAARNDDASYLLSLEPSFLKFDHQGRVIRMDSFSKTVAPGSRLGWFTCNPLFAERLERQGEISTQAPCGFSQSLIAKLLLSWGTEGYFRWLRGLNAQYTLRRDYFLDCLGEEFRLDLVKSEDGSFSVYHASFKPDRSGKMIDDESLPPTTIFSFVPPTSGMFVWIKLHFESSPLVTLRAEVPLEIQLWTALAEAGVLFAPGSIFEAEPSFDDNVGHFRMSFSNSEFVDTQKAIAIFNRVLRQFFDDA